MKFLRKVIGPKSKYDKSIPYAYLAKVFLLENDKNFCRYFYGDTICSLIEHLIKEDIDSAQVSIFGIFRGDEIEIDKKFCTSRNGKWLLKPDLCRSLENQYLASLDKIYRGHLEKSTCKFDDRESIII